MAYNPGISYQGGAGIARGMEMAGRALGAGLQRRREAKERKEVTDVFRKYLEVNPEVMRRLGIDDVGDLSPNQIEGLSDVMDLDAQVGMQQRQELQMEQAQQQMAARELQMEQAQRQFEWETQARDREAVDRGYVAEAMRGSAAPDMRSGMDEARLTGMPEIEAAARRAGTAAPPSPQNPADLYGGTNPDDFARLQEIYQPQGGAEPKLHVDDETGRRFMQLGGILLPADAKGQPNARAEHEEQRKIRREIAGWDGRVKAIRLQLRSRDLTAHERFRLNEDLDDAQQELGSLRAQRDESSRKDPGDTPPVPRPAVPQMTAAEFSERFGRF